MTRSLRRWIVRTLAGIAIVLALATCFLSYEEGWSLGDAFLAVLVLFASGEMVGFELADLQGPTRYLVVFTIYAGLLGMAMLMGAVVDTVLRMRLAMLFEKKGRKMKNHVILCGLGHVGYRVLQELQKFGQDVIVIEKDEHSEFVHEILRGKVPIIFDDVRHDDSLRRAGIENARAIIACTDNDLINIEVALDSREMNPAIRVVVRLFDQRLADKIAKGFEIQVAFSSSSLAAPAFAAAAVDSSVKSSFYVGERLFVYCEIPVDPSSGLVGRTVAELRDRYETNTLLIQPKGGGLRWTPSASDELPAGALASLVGPFERIRGLEVESGLTRQILPGWSTQEL
ncbi:MAG: NAD-binding protein [Planctomycetes bacterium]|nr:NAD-binding protein [Planctomycetota bacterium]